LTIPDGKARWPADHSLHNRRRRLARTVVGYEELGKTPEEIANDYGVPLQDVKAVVGFYHTEDPH
jgi:uncharacterized protein (DUF433 family)